MTEYWIWSNQHGAWWAPGRLGYTRLLQEAGRYSEVMVEPILTQCNLTIAPTAWPDEVAIPVTNSFLPAAAQEVLGSVAVEELDEAYWKAADAALLAREDLQESLAQMRRGEGREIQPSEFGKSNEEDEYGHR